MEENRDKGIEFSGLTDDLENEEYPISKEKLLEKYGDRELDRPGGTTTVEEVLGPLGREEFDGQDAIHQAIINMVGNETEARPRYSDRSGTVSGENRDVGENTDETEQDSL